MADPIKIKLAQPVKFGSQVVDELTIRPPTGKDFRRLKVESGYEMDATLELAERLSGQPRPVVDGLSGDDLTRVLEVVAGFMPGGPATGSTPSQP